MGRKVIGILTSGGDCPGLNPAIKAAVKKAIELDYDVLGIREGYLGLLDESLVPIRLDRDVIRHIDRLGGTILGTSRVSPFYVDGGIDKLKARVRELQLYGLITLGGEGSLSVAARLYEELGINIVGIPKTIDRDLAYTDYSLGFESALEIITNSVDSLRSTAESHSRVFVVEVMGRNAGHLALRGGISSAASVILIPEHKFKLDRVCELLLERKKRGVRYSIVMCAEGATSDDLIITTEQPKRLGGISYQVADEIERRSGLESRAVVLSHLQRGGQPVAYDRRMGFYFGVASVEAIHNQHFGTMVALKHGRVQLASITEGVRTLRLVDVDRFYDTNIYRAKQSILGMSGPVFGDDCGDKA